MRFGNWRVTGDGIENIVNNNWFIDRNVMMSTRAIAPNEEVYDLLLHTAEKLDNLQDIMCLNLAYIYSISYYEINAFSELIFNNTIKEQIRFLNES